MSDPSGYTVGWICATAPERVAARLCLDAEHAPLERQDPDDTNIYMVGNVGPHQVVIVSPSDGSVSAATAAVNMVRTFPNLRFGLLVGVGDGAPDAEHDIRLGDVVVSFVTGSAGAVWQFDFGEATQGQPFRSRGHLNRPPAILLAAARRLEGDYLLNGNPLRRNADDILQTRPHLHGQFSRPAGTPDRLYKSQYPHQGHSRDSCSSCCGNDDDTVVSRPDRQDAGRTAVFHGLIASSNQLVRDAEVRDRLAQEKGVLCFEKEAAGLMNAFSCLVVRGISGYADSHPTSGWEGCAALAAAIYARDILKVIPPNSVTQEQPLRAILPQIQRTIEDTSVGTISRWLDSPDPSSILHESREKMVRGYGKWFLEDARYQQWKSGENKFLCIQGRYGTGKTFLMSSVILDLMEAEENDCPLCYFYFEFQDPDKGSFKPALKRLAVQLYTRCRSSRVPLDQLKSARQGDHPSTDDLCQVFEAMAQRTNRLRVVLDALDEQDSKALLVPWMHSLLRAVPQISILATTGEMQDTLPLIRPWALDDQIIELLLELTASDLELFIHSEISNMEFAKNGDRAEVRKEIARILSEKWKGQS